MTATMERIGTPLVLPRVGTPRCLERETLGHEVAEIARRLNKPLMPWQRHVVDVALELDPATGELWYEEIDLTVPRQCGKSTLVLAVMVWRSITMARKSKKPQVSTYVAQHGTAARKKMQRDFIPRLRESSYLKEVPHSRAVPRRVAEWKPSMNNGSEHIYWGTGSWLQVAPPTETASHGDILDTAVIDEAFAHSAAAGGLVEQALDAATITRWCPQLWVVSTAGNGKSEYLWRKVQAGRKACAESTKTRVAYFEWSLPDDADIDDESLWEQYHPAVGHTQTIARLRSRLEKAKRFDAGLEEAPKLKPGEKTEDEEYGYGVDGWRRGYMNQWREIPGVIAADDTDRPWSLDQWEACADPDAYFDEPAVLVFGCSRDRSSGTIGLAGLAPDGTEHVRVIAHADGVTWIPQRVKSIVDNPENTILKVAIDARGPESSLVLDLATLGVGVDLVSTRRVCAAAGRFSDAVAGGSLVHLSQVPLNEAAVAAKKKPLGEMWLLDRAPGLVDPTPLAVCMLALGVWAEVAAGSTESVEDVAPFFLIS